MRKNNSVAGTVPLKHGWHCTGICSETSARSCFKKTPTLPVNL